MNALVTGSNGYIGKNLADYLLHEGILPRNYDIVNHPDQSVCNMEYLNRWVYGIKGVYHLAALPGIKACEDDPDTALNTNVIGTWTVGLVCMSKDIPFIMASSFAVNGGHGVYADTKYLAEKFALRYGGRVCRISNVFGGEDYTEKKNTVVAKLLKGTFKLEGDGTQTRDFIHVEDVCKAMTEIMKEPSGIYEIRSGVQISINELVEIYDMEGDEGLEEALWDGYGHGKNTRHWSKLV